MRLQISDCRLQTADGEGCPQLVAGGDEYFHYFCGKARRFRISNFEFRISGLARPVGPSRAGYTLIELLTAMTILMLAMTLAIQFFHDGFAACRNAIRQSQDHQELLVIKRQWRAAVHRGRGPATLTPEGLAFADHQIVVGDRRLVIRGAEGKEKIVLLPRGWRPDVTLEKMPDGSGGAAVLQLRLAHGVTHRIVACLPSTEAGVGS